MFHGLPIQCQIYAYNYRNSAVLDYSTLYLDSAQSDAYFSRCHCHRVSNQANDRCRPEETTYCLFHFTRSVLLGRQKATSLSRGIVQIQPKTYYFAEIGLLKSGREGRGQQFSGQKAGKEWKDDCQKWLEGTYL